MILAPMCSLNDLGPGSTLEAEPILEIMEAFSSIAHFILDENALPSY